MGWRRWTKNNFRVLIVAESKAIRQELVDYYFKRLQHVHAPNANSIVRRAMSVSDATRKINAQLVLNLVIFSEDFPEKEKDELRAWLSSNRLAPLFITVPFRQKSLARAT